MVLGSLNPVKATSISIVREEELQEMKKMGMDGRI